MSTKHSLKAHLICHTHWDREWYFTREEFRTKLVRLIDGLLKIIDTVPEYVSFMLDGQTIAIEDYLEIKPQNRQRLMNALNSGKIICGPWYILPDELLISGEAHIRNFIMGNKILEGVNSKMNTAYLPDSFGHPQQMPQIVDGLGMDTIVFWRGTANYMKNTEFYWSAPFEDSTILCVHMPCGYGNSGRLSDDMEKTVPRLNSMIEKLGARSTTDVVLLMNGSDHITGQEDIVKIVEEFNAESKDGTQIVLSTLENFVSELKGNIGELETYKGEFRYSERSFLLGGTLSTRMYLKQHNYLVQKNMERYLEPMLALEKLCLNNPDMGGYQNYIWKKILENHPHDSICGCSIDEVHSEMMARYSSLERLQAMLISDSAKRIEQVVTAKGDIKCDVQLMVYEPSTDCLPSYAEIDIDMDMALVQEVDFADSIIVDHEGDITHPGLPSSIKITDENGIEIEHTIISAQKGYYTDYQDETMPEVYKVNRVKVGAMLPPMKCGMHILNVYRDDKKEEKIIIPNDEYIENEFYRISFAGGAFTVLDKKSGKCHEGVNRIIDLGDAGDEYTYSWPENDKEYTLDSSGAKITVENAGGICGKLTVNACLTLPKELNEDRKSRSCELVDSPVEITVTLYKNIDRIDFKTQIDNSSCDHRLQVEFLSGVKTDKTSSFDIFGVTSHKIGVDIPDEWAEYPQSTNPVHGFMDIGDESCGLSAAAKGITEFEAVDYDDQTALRITLLRCVGWLSRTDLITRKGNGGWTIETPDAQCKGTHVFEYSIAYRNCTWQETDCYEQMEKRLYEPYIVQMRKTDGNCVIKNNPLEFLSQFPKGIRISAIKPSENDNSIVVRFYSILNEKTTVSLKLPGAIKNVYLTNLAEKRKAHITAENNMIKLEISPSQIITLELE